MSHTPGPWTFEPHGGFGRRDPDGEPWPLGYISTQVPSPIFEIGPVLSLPAEECYANARLMTAAPELLKALMDLVADVQDYEAWQRPCFAFDRAKEAIAKATGGKQ